MVSKQGKLRQPSPLACIFCQCIQWQTQTVWQSLSTNINNRLMALWQVLWHCWLGVRKSIWPVKSEWCGYLSEARCRLFAIWSSWCHCIPKHPSPLASFKSKLVLPFWYWLTQAVLEKRPLNGCHSSSIFPGLPGWVGTRRNIHPLIPMRRKKDSLRQQGLLWASEGC